MAKSQQSFNKKEMEKKRRKKKQEKFERRQMRKLEKAEQGKKTFEEQLAYVDENGNLSSTPPDPSKKREIKVEDIQLGASSRYDVPINEERRGKVKFFNEEKGYGFIIDSESRESIFVHANNIEGGLLKQNDKVTFEIEMGAKGLNAIKVSLVRSA